MSELSPEPASLVERLHSFFHVELPGNPELASQYALDPSGTLAEHFADLTPADLDDAVRLVSENTTADYADFAGDSGGAEPQFDGESPYAYAFRANYEPTTPGPEAPETSETGPGLEDAGGFDAGLGELSTALDGLPADFGTGLTSYADADPTFGEPDLDTGDTGDTGELGDLGDLGALGAADGADNGDGADSSDGAGESWDGDLHEDPALDTDDGLDPGLDG